MKPLVRMGGLKLREERCASPRCPDWNRGRDRKGRPRRSDTGSLRTCTPVPLSSARTETEDTLPCRGRGEDSGRTVLKGAGGAMAGVTGRGRQGEATTPHTFEDNLGA